MTYLTPDEPLSQVVFVHDYLQLVFEDESYSIYNVAKLAGNGTEWLQGEKGFCDALVNLIGRRVKSAVSSTEYPIVLNFEGGVQLQVLSGPLGARGPEAFQFIDKNSQILVEQNA